jgi:predicted peroxiredoxin
LRVQGSNTASRTETEQATASPRVRAAEEEEEEEEHMAARVVVGCTHGSENADAVTVSYLTAGAALDRGDEVVMWLTSEGVRLALDGYVNPIRAGMEPPVERIHRQFIEKGGRFYVCPICFNDRNLNEADLVAGAELKGATPLMEFVGDGATVFNY